MFRANPSKFTVGISVMGPDLLPRLLAVVIVLLVLFLVAGFLLDPLG